jgi:paraquat-inducible protein B
MDEGKHYFRLGLFVVVTLTILAAVLFLLGGRTLFQPTFTFETYFNESVSGLEVGAPVRFRGVPLGEVTEIVTAAAIYESGMSHESRSKYIVVRGKVTFGAEAAQMRQDAVESVKRGLRVQTQLAGITGQQYLSADFFDPATHPPLPFKWTPKYTYVPSTPSFTSEIIANAQTFLAKLNEADIKRLGQNLNALVVNMDKKMSEVPVAEFSAKARDVLTSANAMLTRIDRTVAAAPIDQTLRRIDSASGRLDALLADPGFRQSVDNVAAISGRVRKLSEDGELDRMVKGIGDTADRLDALVGDNQYDVRVIVQDLRVTADNLRVLSDIVKRYPAGALIGGPPEKVLFPGSSR